MYSYWHSPVVKYIFFGGCTTLVNFLSYYIFRTFTTLDFNVANVLSIVLSILFAYFTNSRFVFESKADTFKLRFDEFIKFVSARISTLILEVVGVWFMVDVMGINDFLSKIMITVLVLVLNYVLSKIFVFNNK
ncbi:MAG: GtrA family protein [Solibacillus sp.]